MNKKSETSDLSDIIMSLIFEIAKNPAPSPYSTELVDWEREIKVKVDETSENIINLLNKKYRVKD